MLRLTRNVGASLRIGDDVEVKVLGFEADGSVRIGIAAPRDKKGE
jgi:carbon storage regulator CsrA